MKKYHIENESCYDHTGFNIELTNEELETLIKVFTENNKKADSNHKPSLYIYDYITSESIYEDHKKSYVKDYYDFKSR